MKIENRNSFIERVKTAVSAKLGLLVFILSMSAMLSSTSVSAQYVSKEIAMHRLSAEINAMAFELRSLVPFTEQYRFVQNKARYYRMIVVDLHNDVRGVADAIEYNLTQFMHEPSGGNGFSKAVGETPSVPEIVVSKNDRIRMENDVKELLAL
ncbi:MAG: hypothetical protein IPM26_15755 [Saprospiraceae bacterium]|jgi:glutamine synthetase type III|nr:hypothetical protein [Saprospiraceae bacterium]